MKAQTQAIAQPQSHSDMKPFSNLKPDMARQLKKLTFALEAHLIESGLEIHQIKSFQPNGILYRFCTVDQNSFLVSIYEFEGEVFYKAESCCGFIANMFDPLFLEIFMEKNTKIALPVRFAVRDRGYGGGQYLVCLHRARVRDQLPIVGVGDIIAAQSIIVENVAKDLSKCKVFRRLGTPDSKVIWN